MSDRHRVVITGLGVVSPIGLNAEETWDSMINGRHGFGPIQQFDTEGFEVRFAAEVKGFDPTNWLHPKDARKFDPYVQFAVAAADMAVVDSGLDLEAVDHDRFGVIIGTGIGGMQIWEEQHSQLLNKGPRRVSPFFIPMMIANMASGQVSIRFGARGPNFAPVSACSSGAHAIGEAFRVIQRGDVDVMICGGSEAAITPLSIGGFASMKALSTRNDSPETASRPFDAERDGFVMGEGAGITVLESYEHAKKRGATIYGEMAGYGMTADAHHITAPAPEGRCGARAMSLAMQDGAADATDVDHINAHGTSTPMNDRLETMAIKTAFGEHAKKLLVNSTKSMTGHLLGGAAGVEFFATAKAVQTGIVPPTINYQTSDPDCDLDYVPNTAREVPIRAALSNSLGFGGHNVCLLVKKFEG